MAAKSKVVIIQEIEDKIKTGGDIKAVDTNTILKDILDCIELNEKGTAGASTFAFVSKKTIIDPHGASLNYSIRGIERSFANITFQIEFKGNNENAFQFKNDNPKIAQVLDSIIDADQSDQMDFLVRIKNAQGVITNIKNFRIGSLSFLITKDMISIKIDTPELLLPQDQIFTSIAVHCPKFNG